MEQYIPKSALVAEIERRIKETESMQSKFDQFWAGQISAFKGILKILDTFEVKEVEETEQRMKECPFRQDICNRYRGTQVKCDGKCSWVVGHLKLKELNAQKGEEV